ncbi:MAG: glycolate oxidase subunit GlcE [Gammaproteobacteria bacterium]|nr:MAG: glycolate oxidase subunit GlcE [Gammaproteobacteria bacterium]
MGDRTRELAEQVQEAARTRTPIAPLGTGSKGFLGNPCRARPLATTGHTGVVDYQPAELVVSVRSGTPLPELVRLLAREGQALPFDPPAFPPGGTVGGAVGAGLAGPGRPWQGAVRDHVLGLTLVDGKGSVLHFGGRVMKNVAGFDVSRLLCGSLGTLGLILEVSLRVTPLPETTCSRVFTLDAEAAQSCLARWLRRPFPVTGAAWEGGRLHLRLAGTEAAVRAAVRRLGGEQEHPAFWTALRDQTLAFFRRRDRRVLWRLSVPPNAPVRGHDLEATLLDWGGAQRWVLAAPDDPGPERLAQTLGGYAVRFRQEPPARPWQVLSGTLLWLNQQVKRSFDPAGIFNPGRLHPGC